MSHAASWVSKIAAAWVASTRSALEYSEARDTASWYARSTTWSTHRVRRLLTERVTISVPATLYAEKSTSSPPITANTTRPAIGITMGSPPRHRTYRGRVE